MNELSSPPTPDSALVSRAELDDFLNVLTHEIRNRLNMVSLEASDLTEQFEGEVDVSQLQRRVQECSEYLKQVRDLLNAGDAPGDSAALSLKTAHLRAGDFRPVVTPRA